MPDWSAWIIGGKGNMEFTEKKFLVAGAGISGLGAVKLLLDRGSFVLLYDSNENLEKEKIKEQFGKEQEKLEIKTGILQKEWLQSIEAMIISPGISCEEPFVEVVKQEGVPIWSEIELAWQAGKGDVIAITGTNGKTTTTALMGKIMQDYFESVFVVGNIGIPYTGVVQETKDDSVIVAEISSFQLETIREFHPKITAVLNVTPDHLNRHKTMENYALVKQSISKNQTKDEFCILNYDDKLTRAMGEKITAMPVYFSHKTELEEGVFLREKTIFVHREGKEIEVCHIEDLKLLGMHNVENVMAAVAMAVWFGVPVKSVAKSVKEFKAVEHRIEFVDTVNGVDYYNDSKGTNPDAAIKGIQAMKKPTHLIGGGYDKGTPFDDWIQAFDGKVRELVLLGQTAKEIANTAKKYGFHDIVFVDSLEEAVLHCAKNAKEGEVVLLSPACASWGMFKNYEERGCQFKEYVKNLKE